MVRTVLTFTAVVVVFAAGAVFGANAATPRPLTSVCTIDERITTP